MVVDAINRLVDAINRLVDAINRSRCVQADSVVLRIG